MAFLFDPVQRIFNGDFWPVFNNHFRAYLKGRIIDMACGTGEMRKYIKPKTYLGIDINPEYVKRARKNYPFPNTRYEVGNILNLKLSGQYDCAFLISAAHHLSDGNLLKLCESLKGVRVKYFVLVDGYPIGLFKGLLAWLDDKLGGGAYFRSLGEIKYQIEKEFKILKSGEFSARASLYRYPYVIISIK